MSYRDRLRRRMVRAAVRENVDTLRGLPPPALRRPRRIRDALLRHYRSVLAPALLLLAVGVLGAGGTGLREGGPAGSLESLAASLTRSMSPPVAAATFPLAVRRIVLDPGHGGLDPGSLAPNDLAEKDLTLDVAHRLRALLEGSGFAVLLTRERDETVSLRERALLANRGAGDLFVSIHVNAVPGGEPCGMETYHLGATADERARELASLENAESGYTLADLRRLLEGLYAHARQAESRQFAGTVQRGLAAYLTAESPPIKDNGVKTAPFVVLVATEMPGILAEVSCLSNDAQAQLLADPAHRQRIARGLFVGIRAYADARHRPGRTGPPKGATS